MEHFKSTIVTTAVLVTGLITAAHVLHPRDAASEMRRARPSVATTAAATAWSDPPSRAAQVATAGTEVATPRPASFTLLPVAMTTNLSGIDAPMPNRPTRKAETVRGHRLVQVGNRTRSASVEGARAELQSSSPAAATGESGKAAQGDPIGDLLKVLGIGRDSEG